MSAEKITKNSFDDLPHKKELQELAFNLEMVSKQLMMQAELLRDALENKHGIDGTYAILVGSSEFYKLKCLRIKALLQSRKNELEQAAEFVKAKLH